MLLTHLWCTALATHAHLARFYAEVCACDSFARMLENHICALLQGCRVRCVLGTGMFMHFTRRLAEGGFVQNAQRAVHDFLETYYAFMMPELPLAEAISSACALVRNLVLDVDDAFCVTLHFSRKTP